MCGGQGHPLFHHQAQWEECKAKGAAQEVNFAEAFSRDSEVLGEGEVTPVESNLGQ